MKSPIERINFDPSNDHHRDVFYEFLKTGKWNLHFKLEQPWLELPAMCSYKTHMWNHEQDKLERVA